MCCAGFGLDSVVVVSLKDLYIFFSVFVNSGCQVVFCSKLFSFVVSGANLS